VDKIIELTPIEYYNSENRCRIWEYEYIDLTPAVNRLKEKFGDKLIIHDNPDGSSTFQYLKKPPLIIKKGRIYATSEDVTKYGLKQCEHQATFPLRLLKYNKYLKQYLKGAKRTSIPLPRFEFLKSSFQVNQTKVGDGLKITLTRAGIYTYKGITRLAFDITAENTSNKKAILYLTKTVICDELGHQFGIRIKRIRKTYNKVVHLKPNSVKEIYCYSSRKVNEIGKDVKIVGLYSYKPQEKERIFIKNPVIGEFSAKFKVVPPHRTDFEFGFNLGN